MRQHGDDLTARIVKFNKDGKCIKNWGNEKRLGPRRHRDIPHALAMDLRGRLFLGDRQNNWIQIFDQEPGPSSIGGSQFSRSSGVGVDKNDIDAMWPISESASVSKNHDGYKRGTRVGRVSDGVVTAFIPDPGREGDRDQRAAEGVAAGSGRQHLRRRGRAQAADEIREELKPGAVSG